VHLHGRMQVKLADCDAVSVRTRLDAWSCGDLSFWFSDVQYGVMLGGQLSKSAYALTTIPLRNHVVDICVSI
jgi:hypothetical protein